MSESKAVESDRCGCSVKNDWSNEEEAVGECLSQSPEDSKLCSKPAGHDGPHAACTFGEHPMKVWESESGSEKIECPCCRDETFSHRDYLLDHLQQYHSPAEVFVAVVE